jgi:hypothetical protein
MPKYLYIRAMFHETKRNTKLQGQDQGMHQAATRPGRSQSLQEHQRILSTSLL